MRQAVPSARSRSAFATSAGGRSSSTRIIRVEGTRPRRRMSSENDARCRRLSTRGRATKVPLPWIRWSRPPATRLSIALRTVARETSYVAISSRSDGMAAPGPRSRVATSASTSLSWTCLGRGPSSMLRAISTSRRFAKPLVRSGTYQLEHGSSPPTLSRTTMENRPRDAHGVRDRRAALRSPPHARPPAARAAPAARPRRGPEPGAPGRPRVERQRRHLRALPARGGGRCPGRPRRTQRRHPLPDPARPLGHGGGLGVAVGRHGGDRRDPAVGPRVRRRHGRRHQRGRVRRWPTRRTWRS